MQLKSSKLLMLILAIVGMILLNNYQLKSTFHSIFFSNSFPINNISSFEDVDSVILPSPNVKTLAGFRIPLDLIQFVFLLLEKSNKNQYWYENVQIKNILDCFICINAP